MWAALPETGAITVTNVGDSLHAGSLKITGLQTAPGVYVPSVQLPALGLYRAADGTARSSRNTAISTITATSFR